MVLLAKLNIVADEDYLSIVRAETKLKEITWKCNKYNMKSKKHALFSCVPPAMSTALTLTILKQPIT